MKRFFALFVISVFISGCANIDNMLSNLKPKNDQPASSPASKSASADAKKDAPKKSFNLFGEGLATVKDYQEFSEIIKNEEKELKIPNPLMFQYGSTLNYTTKIFIFEANIILFSFCLINF